MVSKKNTKKALLMSALSLLLCCSMLIGTTFAWFTDEVTSGKNQIIAGNLDVELEYAKVVDGQITGWDTVAGKTAIFDPNALWEPGRVEVVYLKVSNLGTLELKYQLGVNVISETPSINVNDEAFKLSEHLVFKVVEMPDALTTYTDREVAQLTAGTEKGLKDYNGETKALDPKDGANDEDYVALIVYMPETVGNEANYKTGAAVPTINLGINLFATQKDAESDSFGPDYDEYAGLPWDGETVTPPVADANGVIHITNAAELVAMMDVTGNSIYIGKTIVLDADIDLNGNTVKGIGGGDSNFTGTFDGQGHTISNFTVDASDRSYYAGLFNQVSHGGTVKNLTVKNATVIGKSMVGAIASSVDSNAVIDNCKAIDCTLIGVKKVGAVVGYTAGSTVTNNYAENCTVYYSEKEGGEVLGYEYTGSTVSDNTFKDVTVKKATVITTAEELLALGGKSLEGTYEIMADINLNGAAMPTIGAAYGKTLTISGNGHTISNATTAHTDHNGMKHHGFFYAYTNSILSISDLSFENIVIDATKDTEQNYGAAVVVAYADGGSTVNLSNVDVKNSKVLNNTPDIGDEAGVYLGYQTGTLNMVDCDSTGCVVAGETAEKTGAFIGMVNGNATLTNCTTDLTIGACNRISGTLVVDGVHIMIVDTNAELKAALSKDVEYAEVNLQGNVAYDVTSGNNNQMGSTSTKTITINGNGHTLTFNHTNPDWNNIVTAGAKLIINNAHLTNSGKNDGPRERHNITFACEVELNKVTSDKAIALGDNAVLKGVTIKDERTSEDYAMWIEAKGQTIIIDGLTIDMGATTGDRGIKIADQHISAPAKVTLKVSNAEFETGKYAAILVSSSAGADITLENVNISGCAADKVNAVWVDDSYVAADALVTVFGGTKIIKL